MKEWALWKGVISTLTLKLFYNGQVIINLCSSTHYLLFFPEEYRQIDQYLTSPWNVQILISSTHRHLLQHQQPVNQVAEALMSKLPINTLAHG